MSGSSRMSEVDLSAVPASTEVGVAPRDRHRRRNVVILASAVLVVVLALVATQLALGARERSAVAQLDGVIGTLDAAPVILWDAPAPAQTLWQGPLGDDAVAEVIISEDGTKQLQALETATGKPRWSLTLAPPSAARTAALAAGDAVSDDASCATTASTGDAVSIVCLVSDGFTRWGDDTAIDVAATSTTLQVIDRANGSVTSSWPVTGSSFVLRRPHLAVTADRTDGGIEVAQYDLRTGERTWTRQIPSPSVVAPVGDHPELFGFGDYVGVQTSGTSTLLDAHGTVVREDLAAYPTTNRFHVSPDHVVLVRGSGNTATTTVVAAGGSEQQDVTARGSAIDITTDDGSLPGLLLTAGVGLNATDDDTGDLRWNVPDLQASDVAGALVLRGVVYVQTMSDVVAVDGSTGAVRWSIPRQSVWDKLVTDGERLIVLHGPEEQSTGALAAYALGDGDEVWRAGYPEDVGFVDILGHALYGWRADGSLVALG